MFRFKVFFCIVLPAYVPLQSVFLYCFTVSCSAAKGFSVFFFRLMFRFKVEPLDIGKHNFNADEESERNKWVKQLDISNYGFTEADLDKVMSFDIISKQRNQTGIIAQGAK